MRLCVILISLCLFTACQDWNKEPSKPYQARVVTSHQGAYTFETVTLNTLTDIDTMQGTIGAIIGGGVLNMDAPGGDVIGPQTASEVYKNRGHAVNLHYLVRSGVVYPTDFASMEMLSLYYEYERVTDFWQKSMGFVLTDPKPKLYYDPTMETQIGNMTIEGTAKMNAAFMPVSDDFFFFTTASQERIPVKVNLAIVAHEFTHYMFNRGFAQQDSTIYSSDYTTVDDQLNGMNEGIADFFAYVVTGQTNEFARSIPNLAATRALPVGWTMSTLDTSLCAGSYYCKGSILASALYEISTKYSYTPAGVAKVVFDALPAFRASWLLARASPSADYDILINSILASLSDSDKANYCAVFVKWFDDITIRTLLSCS